jgi:hypothetical protein
VVSDDAYTCIKTLRPRRTGSGIRFVSSRSVYRKQKPEIFHCYVGFSWILQEKTWEINDFLWFPKMMKYTCIKKMRPRRNWSGIRFVSSPSVYQKQKPETFHCYEGFSLILQEKTSEINDFPRFFPACGVGCLLSRAGVTERKTGKCNTYYPKAIRKNKTARKKTIRIHFSNA